MLISYIIPAYNCAKTIANTVKSILFYNKSNDFEILIIENGSTDNTPKVLGILKEKYPCVKILKSKKGASRARNKGIDESKGKWLWFVDADDQINFDIKNILIGLDNVDLIIGNYQSNNSKINLVETNKLVNKSVCDTFKLKMISDPTRYMTLWTKIFKASIIKKYNIRLNNSLKVSEDSEFVFRYLLRCRSIFLLNKYIYLYSTLDTSTMRKAGLNSINYYTQAMCVMSKNLSKESYKLNKAIYKYICSNFFVSMVRGVFPNPHIKWKNKVYIVKKTKNISVYENSFRNIGLSDIRENPKLVPAIFLKYNLTFIASIMLDIKAKINGQKEGKKS